MKLFGVILLTGYFLAREKEGSGTAQKNLEGMLKEWGLYLVCSGLAVFFGFFLYAPGQALNPSIFFLTAALPTIILKGRPTCMIAGAATAFCVLRLMPEGRHVLIALACVEVAVLSCAFLYLGTRVRMTQLFTRQDQKAPQRLLALFAVAVLLMVVYQKAVQLLLF